MSQKKYLFAVFAANMVALLYAFLIHRHPTGEMLASWVCGDGVSLTAGGSTCALLTILYQSRPLYMMVQSGVFMVTVAMTIVPAMFALRVRPDGNCAAYFGNLMRHFAGHGALLCGLPIEEDRPALRDGYGSADRETARRQTGQGGSCIACMILMAIPLGFSVLMLRFFITLLLGADVSPWISSYRRAGYALIFYGPGIVTIGVSSILTIMKGWRYEHS